MSNPPEPGRRRVNGVSAPRGVGGFSLVELLVVIFIMGIVFLIGGQEVARAWKRQKLQSASTDLKILMQRALPEMQRRNMQMFVQVGPLVSNADVRYLPIYLIGDANGNGAIDAPFTNPPAAGKDLLIDEYDIVVLGKSGIKGVTGASQDFCLSVENVMQIQSNRWMPAAPPPAPPCTGPFCDDVDWTKGRSIMCDFQGRAIDVTTRLQLAGPATLVLTHADVVNGGLRPSTRYILSINPVWSIRVQKQTTVDAPTSPTAAWLDQLGG